MVSSIVFIGSMIILSVLKSHGVKEIAQLQKPIRILLMVEVLGIGLELGEFVYRTWFYPTEIERPEQGEGNITEVLIVEADGQQTEVEVEISEQAYTQEEAEELFATLEEQLVSLVLGNNASQDYVDQKLQLETSYLDGAVTTSWTFHPSNIISADGQIAYEEILDSKQGETVAITCEMHCGTYAEQYAFPVQVYVPKVTTAAGFTYYLDKSLEAMDEEMGSVVTLPTSIQGVDLHWTGLDHHYGVEIAILASVACIGIILGKREETRREHARVRREKQRDYPQIVAELALYTAAGVTIKNSFQKMAQRYEKREDALGFQEVVKTWHEMEEGVSEVEAYEHFGNRVGLPEYRKLSLLVIQNVRFGADGLTKALEKEEMEAFQMRKNMAKTAGEEASTKLLLPMMGLLLMVLVIMLVPALMNIQI